MRTGDLMWGVAGAGTCHTSISVSSGPWAWTRSSYLGVAVPAAPAVR
jgi:hypothetical protein